MNKKKYIIILSVILIFISIMLFVIFKNTFVKKNNSDVDVEEKIDDEIEAERFGSKESYYKKELYENLEFREFSVIKPDESDFYTLQILVVNNKEDIKEQILSVELYDSSGKVITTLEGKMLATPKGETFAFIIFTGEDISQVIDYKVVGSKEE